MKRLLVFPNLVASALGVSFVPQPQKIGPMDYCVGCYNPINAGDKIRFCEGSLTDLLCMEFCNPDGKPAQGIVTANGTIEMFPVKTREFAIAS